MTTKTSKSPEDFAAFILTNGRPDNVLTYNTLREHGYTGPIYLIVDDLDATRTQYIEKYGSEVIVFDKKAVAKTFDNGNNFQSMSACVHARNASFDIAKKLGIKYFVQLDDDYFGFLFKFDEKMEWRTNPCRLVKNLDVIFSSMLKFLVASGAASIAFAQEGDFLFGETKIFLKRKCMNSWFCRTDKPIVFTGTMNDDVNTYVRGGALGDLFFTVNQVSIQQPPTQQVAGGMTEIYRAQGTYVKSFYTVMMQPSSVKIGRFRGRSGQSRIHHHITWNKTVPKILRESVKK